MRFTQTCKAEVTFAEAESAAWAVSHPDYFLPDVSMQWRSRPTSEQHSTTASGALEANEAPLLEEAETDASLQELDGNETSLLEAARPKYMELASASCEARKNRLFLDLIPLLDAVSSERKDLLAAGLRKKIFEAGAIVIKQGDPSTPIHMVMEGELVVYKGLIQETLDLTDQKEFARLRPLTICGNLSGDQRAKATVIAAVRSEVLLIHFKQFHEALGTEDFERCRTRRQPERASTQEPLPEEGVEDTPSQERKSEETSPVEESAEAPVPESEATDDELPDKDPWSTLGITPGAPAASIRAAYYELSRRFHPDKNGGRGVRRMQQITAAYEALRAPPASASSSQPPMAWDAVAGLLRCCKCGGSFGKELYTRNQWKAAYRDEPVACRQCWFSVY